MSRLLRIALIGVIIFLIAVPAVMAQKKSTQSEAQIAVNKALAELGAWKNKNARRTLQSSKAKYGSTPEFKTAWALLEIQENTGKNESTAKAGEQTLTKTAKSSASDPVASYYQGEMFYQHKKNKEANSAWQAAAKKAGQLASADPTNATAQYYLGAARVRTKKFAPARDALILAVRGGFDPAMVNYQIGLSHMFAEQWQQALDAFNLGLAVEPRFAHMYYWRGLAWDKLGRKDNMLLDLDQFLKLAPNAPESGRAKSILKSAG